MRSRPETSPEYARRNRVLLLNWRDSGHPESGGSEHFVEQVALGLHAKGYEVTLRCPHYPGASHEGRVGDLPVVRRGGRFTVYPRAMLHLLTHRRAYDLIVDVQNGVPFWSPLVTSTPVLVLVHHVHRDVWPAVFRPGMARLGWWLESRVAPRVYSDSRYATVSEATLGELVELGVEEKRITLVYNGSDAPSGTAATIERTPWPSLVVLGRVVRQKRVELAIEAVASLRAEFPDLTLTVIGQGYWLPQLRSLVDRLGVSDAVTFTGFVDEATKYRLLGQSWVHVLPSLKEGWGLSILDAAASATSSVAFRSAGGTTESIVDGVTGLLLDDDECLIDRLAELLRRPELCRRLGEQARVYGAQFTWAKTVDRFGRLAELAIRGDASLSLPRSTPRAIPVPAQRRPEGSQLRLPGERRQKENTA